MKQTVMDYIYTMPTTNWVYRQFHQKHQYNNENASMFLFRKNISIY